LAKSSKRRKGGGRREELPYRAFVSPAGLALTRERKRGGKKEKKKKRRERERTETFTSRKRGRGEGKCLWRVLRFFPSVDWRCGAKKEERKRGKAPGPQGQKEEGACAMRPNRASCPSALEHERREKKKKKKEEEGKIDRSFITEGGEKAGEREGTFAQRCTSSIRACFSSRQGWGERWEKKKKRGTDVVSGKRWVVGSGGGKRKKGKLQGFIKKNKEERGRGRARADPLLHPCRSEDRSGGGRGEKKKKKKRSTVAIERKKKKMRKGAALSRAPPLTSILDGEEEKARHGVPKKEKKENGVGPLAFRLSTPLLMLKGRRGERGKNKKKGKVETLY